MTTPAQIPVLVMPTLEGLGGYEAALARGWSPDPRRMGDAGYVEAELRDLREDRARYLDKILGRPEPGQSPAPMPLTNHALWIWDGEFAGKVDLRYVPAAVAVPEDVPGHVGYSVVPWKQGRGYATAALKAVVGLARNKGLAELQILCNVENLASKAVIERAGGELYHHGPHPSDRPDQQKLYYRIRLVG